MKNTLLKLLLAAVPLAFTACMGGSDGVTLAFQPTNNTAHILIEQRGKAWTLKVDGVDKTVKAGFKFLADGTTLDGLAFPFELTNTDELPLPHKFTINQTIGTDAKCPGCGPGLVEWAVIFPSALQTYARKLFG